MPLYDEGFLHGLFHFHKYSEYLSHMFKNTADLWCLLLAINEQAELHRQILAVSFSLYKHNLEREMLTWGHHLGLFFWQNIKIDLRLNPERARRQAFLEHQNTVPFRERRIINLQELCFCTFADINSCPNTDYTALFVCSCVCRSASMVSKKNT